MASNTQKTSVLGMFNSIEKKPIAQNKTNSANKILEPAEDVKKEEVNAEPKKEPKTVSPSKTKKVSTKKAVEKMGRPNTRGKKGEDYNMVNIAVPIDVYNKLKEASNQRAAGNLTYYINMILKEAADKL